MKAENIDSKYLNFDDSFKLLIFIILNGTNLTLLWSRKYDFCNNKGGHMDHSHNSRNDPVPISDSKSLQVA
jgi:hypothetical protein